MTRLEWERLKHVTSVSICPRHKPPACERPSYVSTAKQLHETDLLLSMHIFLQEASGKYEHGCATGHCDDHLCLGLVLARYKEPQEELTELAETSVTDLTSLFTSFHGC